MQGTYFILNMRAVNTDVVSYINKTLEKILVTAEREKRHKYLDACLQQRRCFSHFFISLDGLLGTKVDATLKRLASHLATKWRQTYSRTCGYVQRRFAITMVRSTHRCIRGSQVPTISISAQRPQWEDGTGLHLYS